MFHNVPVGIHYNTWIILRACSLFSVWKVRCSAAYDSEFPGPVTSFMLFTSFKAQLASYANAHYVSLDYNPSQSSDFHNMWVPGFFCIFRDHSLHIVASPPSFRYTPQLVCNCTPLITHTITATHTDIHHTDDFIPLPPHPRRCPTCGAPPPFYPVSTANELQDLAFSGTHISHPQG